jgi:hypothetical protein
MRFHVGAEMTQPSEGEKIVFYPTEEIPRREM